MSKQVFGQRCTNTNQCQSLGLGSRLVCSSVGALQNLCLYDQGGQCATNNDCANTLTCNKGYCGCQSQFIYNQLTSSCFNLASNLGSKCNQDSDCGSSMLFCDTSIYGNVSYTCRLGLNQNCVQFSDCVNNLQCGYSLTCGCVYIYIFI